MSLDNLLNIINNDTIYRQNSINLNASENYTSPFLKKILNLPVYDNYTFPPAGGKIEGLWKFNPKTYDQQVNEHINLLCSKLLGSAFIDPRPKGGQAAEICILTAFAEPGDAVFYVDVNDGGHFGLNYIASKCGIALIPVIFNQHTQLIDINKTLEKMDTYWKKSQNKLVIFGQSYVLRKQPFFLFSESVKSTFPDAILSCDISHTLGLVIGRHFPNPLLSGFDIIHASTHKTFPGPQKAIIALSKNSLEFCQKIETVVSPGFYSNCGTSEIYALAYALEEMNVFGYEYAENVCSNAKYFAKILADIGFNVLGEDFCFTETHQIWIQIGDEKSAWHAASLLHQANIRAFPTFLPFTDGKFGLRLGTNAMTRRGFKENEFSQVADFIKAILIDKKDPETLKLPIAKFLNGYPLGNVCYTFKNFQNSINIPHVI